MSNFQAYAVGPDGHIKQRIDLSSADERAANEIAKSLGDCNTIELWQSDRLIATLHADPIKAKSAVSWIENWLRPPT